MAKGMSSRERMLAALNCEKTDHIPMAFMIFAAVRERLRQGGADDVPSAAVEAQVELGLDTVVDLHMFSPRADDVGHSDAPGTPVRFGKGVKTRVWAETSEGAPYPVLHKDYVTPDGPLTVAVSQTDDWPYGDVAKGEFNVPFMDDFLAPRCSKYLVEKREDLKALRHLLVPPTAEDLTSCRHAWGKGKALARKHDLLVTGGRGVGGDALAWFCGLQNAVMMAIDDPPFLEELLSIIDEWNRPRMRAFLDCGVDLFIRRAWYEGTDFWSPDLYRQFFVPILREEVRMVHEAGAKFGYILTSGAMPLLDMLLDLEIDVMIGVDPIQGKGTDMRAMREKLQGRMCTWGGVNGFITVEQGTKSEIEGAVRQAIDAMGPDGFVLSPVDNVTDPADSVWENVAALIEAWERVR